MTAKLIPTCWETNRLIIQDMTAEEIPVVQDLYEQGRYIEKVWGGRWSVNSYLLWNRLNIGKCGQIQQSKIGQLSGFGRDRDLIPFRGFMETENTVLVNMLT
ncbi:hypothetical protein ACQ0QQ_04465 [Lysinibacillus sphaericus]